MFGNLDRMQVIIGIVLSETRAVNATDLQWELRLANNRVRAQLVSLAELGLLDATPTSHGKRYFVRKDSAFWGACVELYEQWRG